MDSPKCLTGLEYFNKMLNTDKTIYLRPAGGDWKLTVDAFANGKVGMFRAEEWVIEYIRDVMTENGTNEEYGLTYFPMVRMRPNMSMKATAATRILFRRPSARKKRRLHCWSIAI